MSTHEITATDCTWADLHFSDLSEAREHLEDLKNAKHRLLSLRSVRAGASNSPALDRAIKENLEEQAELEQLILDCSLDALFD